MVQDDEEQNGARNVDEGVDAIGPAHESWALEEPLLNGRLNENAKTLFGVDDLQGMLACGVNGRSFQGQGGEGAAKLVHLKQGQVSNYAFIDLEHANSRENAARNNSRTQ